ncbi:hypothetical protein ACTXT7_000702 [Hymenolepis weldensis]
MAKVVPARPVSELTLLKPQPIPKSCLLDHQTHHLNFQIKNESNGDLTEYTLSSTAVESRIIGPIITKGTPKDAVRDSM